MTPNAGKPQPNKTYVFNVDLMLEGETNALALERLLRLLNQADIEIGRAHV